MERDQRLWARLGARKANFVQVTRKMPRYGHEAPGRHKQRGGHVGQVQERAPVVHKSFEHKQRAVCLVHRLRGKVATLYLKQKQKPTVCSRLTRAVLMAAAQFDGAIIAQLPQANDTDFDAKHG